MKTFDDFLAERTLAQKIVEAAQLITQKTDDPNEFIQAWYEENEPEIAALLIEAGFWQGVKDAGSQMMGGLRAGAQAFGRQMFGPQAKFDTASKALGDLSNILSKDQTLAQWAGEGGNKLIDQVNRMIQYLNKLRPTIPQSQTQQAQNNWASAPGAPAGAGAPAAGAPPTIPHPATAAGGTP